MVDDEIHLLKTIIIIATKSHYMQSLATSNLRRRKRTSELANSCPGKTRALQQTSQRFHVFNYKMIEAHISR